MKPLRVHTRNAQQVQAVFVALLMAITLTACTFEVQPIEDYTSPNGNLSFTMPADWEVLIEEEWDATSALVGSVDNILYYDVAAFPMGEAWVELVLVPSYLPDPDGEILRATPHEFLSFALEDQMMAFPDIEITTMTLANGRDASMISVPTESYEIQIYSFEVADEITALATLMKAANEGDEAVLAEIDMILNSVEFSGERDAFVDGYLGLLEDAIEASAPGE